MLSHLGFSEGELGKLRTCSGKGHKVANKLSIDKDAINVLKEQTLKAREYIELAKHAVEIKNAIVKLQK